MTLKDLTVTCGDCANRVRARKSCRLRVMPSSMLVTVIVSVYVPGASYSVAEFTVCVPNGFGFSSTISLDYIGNNKMARFQQFSEILGQK